MEEKEKKRKFKTRDIVILIVAFVILLAVLIPTFIILLKKARLTADERAVDGMNDTLEASATVPQNRDGVFSILKSAGYTVPAETKGKALRFYWITNDNGVVLVETTNSGTPESIVYPKQYAKKGISSYREGSEWYWLGMAPVETCDHALEYSAIALTESGSSEHMAICSKCHEVVVEREAHEFAEDGVCSKCGYQKPVEQKPEDKPSDQKPVEPACTHEYPIEYCSIALEEGGASYHSGVCSNCREVMTDLEVHTFGQDGVCSQCGYKYAGGAKPNFTAEELAQSAVWVYRSDSFGIKNIHTERASVSYFFDVPDALYDSIDEIFPVDAFTEKTFDTMDKELDGICIRLNKDTAVEPAKYTHGIVTEECGRPVGINFTLDLNGHELRSNGKSSCTVFYVSGEVEVNILDSSESGAGKLKGYNSTVEIETNYVNTDYPFGLIYVGNKSVLNFYSGTLEAGRAVSGGGIYSFQSTVRLYGGTIKNCSAYYGGGIYLNSAHLFLYGGEISDNRAYSSGAGICAYNNFNSDVTMTGGVIKNNETIGGDGFGGGVYICDGAGFTMSGGQVLNNKAKYGAGFYFRGNGGKLAFTVSGGEISGNVASESGGAFYLSGTVGRTMAFSLTGGTISKNTATKGGNAFYVTYAKLTISQGAPQIAEADIEASEAGQVEYMDQ